MNSTQHYSRNSYFGSGSSSSYYYSNVRQAVSYTKFSIIKCFSYLSFKIRAIFCLNLNFSSAAPWYGTPLEQFSYSIVPGSSCYSYSFSSVRRGVSCTKFSIIKWFSHLSSKGRAIFFKSQFIKCCPVEGARYATPHEKLLYWARFKFLFLFLREAGAAYTTKFSNINLFSYFFILNSNRFFHNRNLLSAAPWRVYSIVLSQAKVLMNILILT